MNNEFTDLLTNVIDFAPSKVSNYLLSKGLQGRNRDELMYGLQEVVNNQGESAIREIVQMHPQYEIIKASLSSFSRAEGFGEVPPEIDTVIVRAPTTTTEPTPTETSDATTPPPPPVIVNTAPTPPTDTNVKDELERALSIKLNSTNILLFIIVGILVYKLFYKKG